MKAIRAIVSGSALISVITFGSLGDPNVSVAKDAGVVRISNESDGLPPAPEPASQNAASESDSSPEHASATVPPHIFPASAPPLIPDGAFGPPAVSLAPSRVTPRYYSSDLVSSSFRIGTWAGDRAGLDDSGDVNASFFFPFYTADNDHHVLFVDARGFVSYDGQGGFSGGAGYRYFDEAHSRIWSLSGWYDYDDGHGRDYYQWGVSFESLGKWLDYRINGYFPAGRDSSVLSEVFTGDSFFQGSTLYQGRQRAIESTYRGVDAEIGGPLPLLGRYGFLGYVGGYYRESNDHGEAAGVNVRFEANVTQDLLVGLSVSDDALFGTNVWMNMALTLPDGRPRRWFRPRPVRERMSDHVERSYRVLTRTEIVSDSVAATTSSTTGSSGGGVLSFAFVDPQTSGTSEGTFENPFKTLAEYTALPEATRRGFTVILVSEASQDNPYLGLDTGITLFDNQRLLSEAILPTIELLPNGFTVPGFAVAANAALPVLSNVTGRNVITLAGNNTEVAGFIIDGRSVANSTGVIGDGISGFNIHSNTFRNYTNAVVLRDVSGTVAGGNAGYFRSNRLLGTPGVSVNGLQVINNGSNSLDLIAGALPLPGASGNLATGNDGDAFRIDALNGAVVDLTFTDNKIVSEDRNRNGVLDDYVTEDVNGNGVLDDGEDINGNGVLDVSVSEDFDGDGILDPGEDINGDGRLSIAVSEDFNGNGVLDTGEDINKNGVLDLALSEDVNGNGIFDTGEDVNEDANGNGQLDAGEDLNNDGFLNIGNGNGLLDLALTEDYNRNNALDLGNGNGLRINVQGLGSIVRGIIARNTITGSRGEDRNLNGILDPSEDLNANGTLDVGNGIWITAANNAVVDFHTLGEDANGNGVLDPSEDRNGNNLLDLYVTEDIDGDGVLDDGEDLNGNGILDVSVSEDFNLNGVLDPGEDINGNGTLEVAVSEDLNGNGILDAGEDANGNGLLDAGEDTNGNGVLDVEEDRNKNGVLDLALSEDLNGNGVLDNGEDVLEVDTNGNGIADAGEDLNGDGYLNIGNGNGRLDLALTEDFNSNGRIDGSEDLDGDGLLDGGRIITGNTITSNTGAGILITSTNDSDASLRFTRNTIGDPADRSTGNGGVGIGISANSGVLIADLGFVMNEDRDEDLNGNGLLDAGEDTNANGILDLANGVLDAGEDVNGNGVLDVPLASDGNEIVANAGGAVSFDLTGTAAGTITAYNNTIIGIGGGDASFIMDGDTTAQPFSVENASVTGQKINRFRWNIAPAGLEFNTDVTNNGIAFAALNGTDEDAGLATVNGAGEPYTVANLSTQLDTTFTRFDALPDEDVNNNGTLDAGEDVNEDANGNGRLDTGEDLNGDGYLNVGNGNGTLDTPELFTWTIDVNGSGGTPTQVYGNQLADSRVLVEFSSGQVSSGSLRIEDLNGNGTLDAGEDLNGNGTLDTQLAALVLDTHNLGTAEGIRIHLDDQATLGPSRFVGNSITDHGGTGLDLQASANATLQSIVIQDNTLTGNGLGTGTSPQGSGVRLAVLDSASITARIEDNRLDDNAGNGVLVDANSGTITLTEINQNTMQRNGNAVALATSNNGTISARVTHNTMDNSSTNSLSAAADSGTITLNEVSFNTMTGNGGDGINLSATDGGTISIPPSEDINGNNALDAGEDVNGNGFLDRGLVSNTLNNNSGNGILVTADNGTLSLGTVANNTITRNTAGTGGIVIDAVDSTVSGVFIGNLIIGDPVNNPSEDSNGNGVLDSGEDSNGNGVLDTGTGAGFSLTSTGTLGGPGSTFDVTVGGTGLDESNLFASNAGAGIAFRVQDTATGTFRILNNTITGTVNDDNPFTDFDGEGIHVGLCGTTILTAATSQLSGAEIDGNTIGDATSDTLGNVGGIVVWAQEDTVLEDLTISNNLIAHNLRSGIYFNRIDAATIDNVLVEGNTIDSNRGEDLNGNGTLNSGEDVNGNGVLDGAGVTFNVANEPNDVLDFHLKDNQITNNDLHGIYMRTESDASLQVDLTNNQIDGNAGDGILIDAHVLSMDVQTTGGTWVSNSISNNGWHGIQVNGTAGTSIPLTIGQVGTDATTGQSLGNVIELNGYDGIELNGFGIVDIANNTIFGNGVGATSDPDQGGGIDVNRIDLAGLKIRLTQNTIEDNLGDGVELQAFGPTELSVTALGNTIESNDGRGVDILNQARSDGASPIMYVQFGDGTTAGMNSIASNDGIGFYVVNTSSPTQNQTDSALIALASDGNVHARPDLVVDLNMNRVTSNNNEEDFWGGGVVLRVGTCNGSRERAVSGEDPRNPTLGMGNRFADATGNLDITGDGIGDGIGDLSGNGVGSNSGDYSYGNGRVNARIVDNTFGGSQGEDVYIESFASTVDPNDTGGTWNDMTFTVDNDYEHDPLARLNLVFRGNTGDSVRLTTGQGGRPFVGTSNVAGAYYNNDDDFKSREVDQMNPTLGGPFANNDRRRNAQRIAGRNDYTGSGALRPTTSADNYLDPQGTGMIFGRMEYDGIGASTFRVESDFDISGFTTGVGFYIDGAIPPYTSNSDSGITFSGTNQFGEERFGWGAADSGSFTFVEIPDYLFIP